MQSIKNDFPIFQHNPELIYLDSASTLQKSQSVLDAVQQYLSHDYANIHRGKYDLSQKSEELYEQSRKVVAEFIGASDASEVIFTSNSTDSANILARSLMRSGWISKGDNIILSTLEHHANLLPWQMVAEQVGAELRRVEIGADGVLDPQKVLDLVDQDTKIISLSLCSNITGVVWREEVKAVSKRIHGSSYIDGSGNPSASAPYQGRSLDLGSPLIVVDASQAAAHGLLDVSDIGCDFCFFTGHKLGALTGIGVLWGRQELLRKLSPGKAGGGAIEAVTRDTTTYLGAPDKFEPGTPNVVGAISLGKAIEYITTLGVSDLAEDDLRGRIKSQESRIKKGITKIEKPLIQYCLQRFKQLEDQGKITLLGGYESERIGVFSFDYHGDMTALEQTMQDHHIALRTGTHCAHIYHDGLVSTNKKTCRISLRVYNELSDVEKFFEVLDLDLR